MFPGRRPRLLLPAAPATALGLREVGTGDARMTIEELRKVRAVAGTHAVDGGIELLLDTGEGDRLALELPLGTLRSLLHTLLLAALERWPALIPTALVADRFGPLAAGNRGDPAGLGHERVPGPATALDDRGVVAPDAVAELVLAQVLPHVLDRVQLRAVGRQGQQREVVGDGEAGRRVPSRPVQDHDGVRARGDLAGDLRQVQAGRRRVDVGQNQGGADGARRADRAEQVGPGEAAVACRPGPGAAARPDPGHRSLLADAGLVLT